MAVFGDRVIDPSLPGQNTGQEHASGGELGINSNRLGKRALARRRLASPDEGFAETEMGLGKVWFQLDRRAEVLDGLVGSSGLCRHEAEVEMGRVVIRSHLKRQAKEPFGP